MSVYRHPPPPPPLSSQQIREKVSQKMQSVFQTHFHISFILTLLQLLYTDLSSPGRMFLSFASFCNLFCLAQRFWILQINSLIYWPPFHQRVFLVSRILLLAVGIVAMGLWARVGWCSVVAVVVGRGVEL